MWTLNYNEAEEIFNKKIFGDGLFKLFENFAKTPNRYMGLFRPTKPKTKIIQNITQSQEIKFGDAFELLIRKCFIENNYNELNRNIKITDNEYLDFDQLFQKNDKIIFIEQKIRDDHDSTKKRGQILNFEKKINILIDKYQDKEIISYFYFIDPDLMKNKNFYLQEISKMKTSYNLEIFLCYGDELFTMENKKIIWTNIIDFLKKWKNKLPDLPDLNYDKNPEDTSIELLKLPPVYFRKCFDNIELVKEIFPILFPEKKTLKLLKNKFKNKIVNQNTSIYMDLIKKIDRINTLY